MSHPNVTDRSDIVDLRLAFEKKTKEFHDAREKLELSRSLHISPATYQNDEERYLSAQKELYAHYEKLSGLLKLKAGNSTQGETLKLKGYLASANKKLKSYPLDLLSNDQKIELAFLDANNLILARVHAYLYRTEWNKIQENPEIYTPAEMAFAYHRALKTTTLLLNLLSGKNQTIPSSNSKGIDPFKGSRL